VLKALVRVDTFATDPSMMDYISEEEKELEKIKEIEDDSFDTSDFDETKHLAPEEN